MRARRPAGLIHPFPQHINELTMKLSVEDVLTRAEALYRQLTACPVSPRLLPTPLPAPPPPVKPLTFRSHLPTLQELPHNVQEVLGLVPPTEPHSPSPPASPLPLSPTRAPPAPPPPEDTAPQPDSSLEILPEEEEEEGEEEESVKS